MFDLMPQKPRWEGAGPGSEVVSFKIFYIHFSITLWLQQMDLKFKCIPWWFFLGRGAISMKCLLEWIIWIFNTVLCVFSQTRHDLASLRGVPRDLGLHAVNSCDLQHHSLSVSRAGVRDTKLHLRWMAPHPHHGHLQHVRLCWQGEPYINFTSLNLNIVVTFTWIPLHTWYFA